MRWILSFLFAMNAYALSSNIGDKVVYEERVLTIGGPYNGTVILSMKEKEIVDIIGDELHIRLKTTELGSSLPPQERVERRQRGEHGTFEFAEKKYFNCINDGGTYETIQTRVGEFKACKVETLPFLEVNIYNYYSIEVPFGVLISVNDFGAFNFNFEIDSYSFAAN